MSRTPFRAVPLRPVPRPKSRPISRRRKSRFRLSPILIVAPLAAFTAVFLWDGGPPGLALDLPFDLPPSRPAASDREAARFAQCSGPERTNCVVDGDTFWYRGRKIRIADINTPETSEPKCVREAELGAKATARLTQLLNAGSFSLAAADRDRDRYGRTLRVVTRGGESLGAALEREGLAEHWRGTRREWC
jgi:micrococcal nuclease